MNNQLVQKKKELENEQQKAAVALRIDYEAEIQKLKLAEYETAKLISAEEDRKKQLEFKHQKELLKIKSDGYTDPVLKSMVLDSTERIYRNLKIGDMRVVNVGGNNGGHQDTAGQLIGQMMASYKSISDSMK